ncbi:MAG: pyrroline-5-carboxylate reductase [Oscillospiraceae bacterium]|nr:pyrroline-5-carboxylate reductase [Oscillospiraceae bacterium]
MINVGFIGAGNMGFAIMKGVCESCCSDKISLFTYDIDDEKIKRLASMGVTPCESVKEVIEKCQYVFLAIKPQQLDEVLAENGKYFTNEKVIVSICAGISGDYFKSVTVADAKVVLVMPNTPLLLGEGATALAKVEPTTDEEFNLVCEIFKSCGKIAVVDENKMKEIIAVNGSSPAFIYLYSKAFIEYAKSVGIDENVAKELFAQTLVGSAKMITDSGYTIDELITMVSSKGGTTIAGLEKLREGNLEGTVSKCCKACVNRAYELSK